MSRREDTIPAVYFEALYAEKGDPWGFRSSPYEHEKYARTLNALAEPHYASALDVGCSIGIFTRMLAARCGRLLAIDASAAALTEAARHCGGDRRVTCERRMVPAEFPPGRFDLIVLSEVLYYLVGHDLDAVAACCFAAQGGAGEIVTCHWLGETDYPLSGVEAADTFADTARAAGYSHAVLHADVYRLDRLWKP